MCYIVIKRFLLDENLTEYLNDGIKIKLGDCSNINSKYSTNTNNDDPKYYNDKDNFTLTRDKKYTNTDINVDDYLGKKNKIENSDDEYNNLHEQLDDLVDYISKLNRLDIIQLEICGD